ncbi:hypothetical protein [Paenibacillus turpanensis]|uniref:hypothetical protein n=1 Tax=Paenibacillus turpanensis TaxID=2689078 RepID=UPI001407F450|nr:hypothetical protein [Paenibacillus turpanensis]
MKAVCRLILVCLFMVVGVMFHSGHSFAASPNPETMARTLPPETEFTIEGFFDPGHEYLDQGSVSIKDNGNQSLTVGVVTEATTDVSTIGAVIYLERWTGSKWVSAGSGTTISGSEKWYFSGESVVQVESGYYYRARVVHFIKHSGVYEQGESVSDYILVK